MNIRHLFPGFIIILLIILEYSPIKSAFFNSLFPCLDLMLIYFVCIYRSELIQNGFLFGAGIFKDILSGAILGINALIYLTLRGLCLWKSEKYCDKGFIFLWFGFIKLFVVVSVIKLSVLSLLAGQFIFSGDILVQFFLTVILYPVFHQVFAFIYFALSLGVKDA